MTPPIFYKVVDDDADMLENAQALEEHSMVAMLDVLQCLGVEPEIATGFAAAISRNKPRFMQLRQNLEHRSRMVSSPVGSQPTFIELYGRGSILEAAHGCRRNLNLQGLGALDLRTNKPGGTPWDFNVAADREMARALVIETCPTWIIGSPPCTAFSKLNTNLNFGKMDPCRTAET